MSKFATPEHVAAVRDLFAMTPANVPIVNEELIEHTKLDLRTIRDAIAQLVQDGLPIISNRDHGYVLCTDQKILSRELSRLRSHSKQIALRADGLANYLLKNNMDTEFTPVDSEEW